MPPGCVVPRAGWRSSWAELEESAGPFWGWAGVLNHDGGHYRGCTDGDCECEAGSASEWVIKGGHQTTEQAAASPCWCLSDLQGGEILLWAQTPGALGNHLVSADVLNAMTLCTDLGVVCLIDWVGVERVLVCVSGQLLD